MRLDFRYQNIYKFQGNNNNLSPQYDLLGGNAGFPSLNLILRCCYDV